MLQLTEDTKNVVELLFPSDQAEEMKKRLQDELSNGLVFAAYSTAESRERIWLAVVKSCKETLNPWNTWFELAKTDWRDLLMAADFGHDTTAHIKWKRKVLTSR